MKQSNFLTRHDVGKGILVTIRQITQENVAKTGAPEEMRWCMHFQEVDKPCVLNSTNGQIIASITKSEDTDNWAGHKIVLYDDPNVSFGGKLVGGIRVRAPRNVAPPVQSAPSQNPQTRALSQAAQVVPPPPTAQQYQEPEGDPEVPF